MKWDCDKRSDILKEWHTKFTWLPIRLGPNDCRWLETLERKGTIHKASGWADSAHWSWEWRAYNGNSD